MSFAAPLAGLAGGGASSAASILGTMLSIAGTVAGIAAEVSAQQYKARVAEQNAVVAEKNAHRAQDAAQTEQQQQDLEIKAFLGEQYAAQSASGLSTDSRSSVLLRKRSREIGRADALNVRAQGDAQSQGFIQQADDFRNESEQAKSAANYAVLGGAIKVGSTLLGMASSSSSRYDPWKGLRMTGARTV